MKGIDCVTRLTPQTAARAKELGFSFVGRYLVPEGMGKHITKAEAEAISGAGLGILCVWETYANRAGEGAGAGGVDGAKALQCAQAIDMPEDGIIYFAVDYDAHEADFPRIAEYLKAARAQTGPYNIGVYGSYFVVEAMASRLPGICRGFWQCVAWSYGNHSPRRTVYQRVWSGGAEAQAAKAQLGFDVDINDCMNLEVAGIWRYKEAADMTGAEILSKLTDAQAYELVLRAQRHAAALPLPAWARDTTAGEAYEIAKADGITDGTRPMAMATRLEAAIMAGRAMRK